MGHVGILTAIARPFRSRAPVLRDMIGFATAVAEERATEPVVRTR
jgi:hypothetical protein